MSLSIASTPQPIPLHDPDTFSQHKSEWLKGDPSIPMPLASIQPTNGNGNESNSNGLGFVLMNPGGTPKGEPIPFDPQIWLKAQQMGAVPGATNETGQKPPGGIDLESLMGFVNAQWMSFMSLWTQLGSTGTKFQMKKEYIYGGFALLVIYLVMRK